MTDPQPHDVDWEAFRYVAAEMSADEVDQYESRLADDQRARDAVAGAVELLDAIAFVSAEGPRGGAVTAPQPARPASSAWGLWLRWIAVGAAAALMFVLLSPLLPWGDRAGGLRNQAGPHATLEWPAGDTTAGQFALLWCDTRDEMALNEPENWPPDWPTVTDAEPEDSLAAGPLAVDPLSALDDEPLDPADPSEAPLGVPSWMLAAVGGDVTSSDDGGATVREN